MRNDDTAEFITPPNTLSAKVNKPGMKMVDQAALEKAEAAITNMSVNYLDWAEEDLNKITTALEDLKANLDDPVERLDKVYQIAHDMKGQGGSFGYNLMTVLGNDLRYSDFSRYVEAGRKHPSRC